MKKIALIITAVLLSVSMLTACGGGDAYELYTAMNTALEDITSMQAKMDAVVDIKAADESISMKMLMDIKEIVRSETDIEMAMLMTIDMGALGSADISMYFKDGWLYQEFMGMKYKSEISLEEAEELVNTESASPLDFTKDVVSKSSVKDVSGGKQLSFTLDGEALSDALTDMVGSLLASLGTDDMDMNISFSDVSYTLLVGSDNLPKEQRIAFSMDMDIDGEKATASYDMNMTDLAYNNVTEIEYPADLADYVEMGE